jgi:uncharacterized protein YbcI
VRSERAQVEGQRLAAITREIVRLHAEHYGKGPERARSTLGDDYVICVMREALTAGERTLVAAGRSEAVHVMRRAWQETMSETFSRVVERCIGRRVEAFLSQISLTPDVQIEFFSLGEPLDGGPGAPAPEAA